MASWRWYYIIIVIVTLKFESSVLPLKELPTYRLFQKVSKKSSHGSSYDNLQQPVLSQWVCSLWFVMVQRIREGSARVSRAVVVTVTSSTLWKKSGHHLCSQLRQRQPRRQVVTCPGSTVNRWQKWNLNPVRRGWCPSPALGGGGQGFFPQKTMVFFFFKSGGKVLKIGCIFLPQKCVCVYNVCL